MPKESYQPPSLISPKNIIEETAASYFSAKNSETSTSPGSEASAFLEDSFFQRVPFSVPTLIFEPIKLRQERSFAECCSGERNDSSRWANIEIGGSHQNLIKLV